MKGTSKVIMGATLVMVVSLAIVLGLILLLLAELYCSLLLRRRRLRIPTSTTTAANPTTAGTTTNTTGTTSSQLPQSQDQSAGSPLSSFYAQGVLRAPRSFLFPAVSSKEDNKVDLEKQHSQLRQILESQTQKSNTSPCRIGIFPASPPSSSFVPVTSPQTIQQASLQASSSGCNDGVSVASEHFVYISNPIYDNDGRPSRLDTPFETPDTSPSRLETDGSSGDDEIAQPTPSIPSSSLPITPPLSPMKQLPAKACSVSLRDARSLGTSGSDSNSINGLSSSSSGSPCTSPSW